MGRTFRRRRRRRRRSGCEPPPPPDVAVDKGRRPEVVALTAWMKAHGWKPACRLTPALFAGTGRGLMAARDVAAGQPLAVVPGRLVVTVDAVSASPFGRHFTAVYRTQQVLATYLMYERHKGRESFWHDYIASLPASGSNAAYCTAERLPGELAAKVADHVDAITATFAQIASEMSSVVCPHCSDTCGDIFTFEAYRWAWTIVNTRAVYISPDCGSSANTIRLSDVNNLALAPYIDMFNHSPVACVRATVSSLDGTYTIVTEKLFKKHSEVFINYGPHSNTKLFLEYGFVVPSNPQDSVGLSAKDIISVTGKSLNKHRMEKLKSFDLLEGHYCTSEGLSWSTRVLTYLLLYSDRLNDEELKSRIFANAFDRNETEAIDEIATVLVETKLKETKYWESVMSDVFENNLAEKSAGFVVAAQLVKENRKLLENCLQSLHVK